MIHIVYILSPHISIVNVVRSVFFLGYFRLYSDFRKKQDDTAKGMPLKEFFIDIAEIIYYHFV